MNRTFCCIFRIQSPSMKIRIIHFLLFFLLNNLNLNAQEVIGSDGGFSNAANGSLSWTIGEVVTETFSNSNNFLTQGFHQNYEDLLDLQTIDLGGLYTIYPNPFINSITISKKSDDNGFDYNIYDCNGKSIQKNSVVFAPSCNELNIDLSFFLPGIYFFEISTFDSGQRIVQQIIKL